MGSEGVIDLYPIGHVAVGYFVSMIISRIRGDNPKLFFIVFFSLLPDLDFLFPDLGHRGPTHSLFVIIVFLFLVILRFKDMLPYFFAFASHSLIGDLFTNGGVQLFWPVTSDRVNVGLTLNMGSRFEIMLEIILFSLMCVALVYSSSKAESNK